MTLLIVGIALFIAAHLVRRLTPGAWDTMRARFGLMGTRAILGAVAVLGTVLMIVGYRSAAFVEVYAPPAWTIHLNNLMMLGAVALLGMGHSKGRSRALLRHPMLTAVAVWAAAHLLVNGDLASVVLFGSLGIWALASMPLVNAAEGPWQRPEPGPISGDIRLSVITVVLFAAITWVHTRLGYWPFPQ